MIEQKLLIWGAVAIVACVLVVLRLQRPPSSRRAFRRPLGLGDTALDDAITVQVEHLVRFRDEVAAAAQKLAATMLAPPKKPRAKSSR